MKTPLKTLLAAAAIGGAAMVVSAPARADNFSISINVGAISFSYQSGGYCDSWGCPNTYWNYPIYYCPVYYRGHWYSGPVYYRYSRGYYAYWIHGAWRRDAWNRHRPNWACVDRYGPPLDLDFYIFNGFHVRDSWRNSWRHHRNDWWNHRRDWDNSREGRDHHDDWHNYVPDQNRNYDWNRQSDWNKDRDWAKPGWKNSYRHPDVKPVITPPAINVPPKASDRDRRNPVIVPHNTPPVNNPTPPKHTDRNRNTVVTPPAKITPPVDKTDRVNRTNQRERDKAKDKATDQSGRGH